MSEYTETQLFEAMIDHLGNNDLPELCLYLRANESLKALYYDDLPEGRRRAILELLPYCVRRNALGVLGDTLQDKFPWVLKEIQVSKEDKLSESTRIPEAIRVYLAEAEQCLSVGLFRSCLAMGGISIESALADKGASSRKGLASQLNELASQNLLTRDLIDWANEVRIARNRAVHPTMLITTEQEDVSQEYAKRILNFAEQFLFVLYIGPSIVQENWQKWKKAGN